MRETLFIADVHLDSQRPDIVALYLDFLEKRARQAEALYILGDLFETWVGDDEDEPVYQKVIITLHKLVVSGLKVVLMRGNRDFLLGAGFAKATGCQLIADPTVINLYGIPTLLMHGDSLCTSDIDYQKIRQQVRDPSWQQQFLSQPLAQRRLLAQQARTLSKSHLQMSTPDLLEVSPEAVISTLKVHGIYHLIHGHTHRPGVQQLVIDGQYAYRRVVGEWHKQEAIILSCTATGCQLLDAYQLIKSCDTDNKLKTNILHNSVLEWQQNPSASSNGDKSF